MFKPKKANKLIDLNIWRFWICALVFEFENVSSVFLSVKSQAL